MNRWRIAIAICLILAAVVLTLTLVGGGRPSAANALVPYVKDRHIGVWSTNPALATGAVVDINVGQLLSYNGVPVTLLSLRPNTNQPGLKMVGSFLAMLCGPGDSGNTKDPAALLIDVENHTLGPRTYYPVIEETHPIEVLTVAADAKISNEEDSPGGTHCSFSPDWIWVIRVTATHKGRYAWTGLVATYRANGESYRELDPANGYVLTYK
jgi:hypothetical protein